MVRQILRGAQNDNRRAAIARAREVWRSCGNPCWRCGLVWQRFACAAGTSQLAIFFERALQADDLGADFFEAWVEAQGAAEGFKRGDGVVLQHVALSHARRRGEVIRIDFERLMAVANGRVVLAEVIVGRAALAPGFGDPR